MKLIRKSEAQVRQGTTFTGETTLAELLVPQVSGGVRVTVVEFSDGSVTHWHTHPGEQVLYVLAGECRVGNEAEEFFTAHAGDVVYTPPNEKHWHGATPGTKMVHISITTGGSPTWMEAPKLDQ
jgi:quercetin dioxygenase-like cupin family protein